MIHAFTIGLGIGGSIAAIYFIYVTLKDNKKKRMEIKNRLQFK